MTINANHCFGRQIKLVWLNSFSVLAWIHFFNDLNNNFLCSQGHIMLHFCKKKKKSQFLPQCRRKAFYVWLSREFELTNSCRSWNGTQNTVCALYCRGQNSIGLLYCTINLHFLSPQQIGQNVIFTQLCCYCAGFYNLKEQVIDISPQKSYLKNLQI